jgi:hypothetical protein
MEIESARSGFLPSPVLSACPFGQIGSSTSNLVSVSWRSIVAQISCPFAPLLFLKMWLDYVRVVLDLFIGQDWPGFLK